MKLNYELISKYEDDLTFYEEYIPLRLFPYINLHKRNLFLKENDLFDEVNSIIQGRKEELRKTSNPYKFLHEDLINWVNENPYFNELII